jgi:hypothetical protein
VSLAVVNLADVKTHLRYPHPTQPHPDDAALMKFIAAADPVIADECDDVLPTAHSERHDGGDGAIFLRNCPVISIQTIEESWGYVSYQLDFVDAGFPQATSMFAYSLDSPEVGQVTRRTVGNVNIRFQPGVANVFVQYTAGLDPIPGNIVLAELELIEHWWRNSQLRAGGAGGAASDTAYDATSGENYRTDSGTIGINIGVPNRIIEMIKGNRHMPYMA